jgi:hypothetical protein
VSSLLVPAILLLLTIPLVVALLRANELFVVRVRQSVVRVARGRIPQALLNDFADVVRRPPVEGAEIRGVVEGGAVRLYVRGDVDEGQRQRLRNTVSTWPVARIRNAPRS